MTSDEALLRVSQIKQEMTPDAQVLELFRMGMNMVYIWSDLEKAEQLLAEAEQVWLQHRSADGEAPLEFGRAIIHYYIQRDPDAIRQLYRSVDSIRRTNNQLRAELLPIAGLVLWSIGDFTTAMECSLESVRLFDERPEAEKPWLPYAFYVLGTQYLDMGDLENAERYFDRGVAHMQQVEANEVEQSSAYARLLIGRSAIALQRKELEQAEAYLRKALTIQGTNDEWMGRSRIYNDLGKVARERGDFEQAESLLGQALELRNNVSDQNPKISTLIELAVLRQRQGRLEAALQCLHEALQTAEKLSAKAKIARIHQEYHDIYRSQGDHEAALYHFEAFYRAEREFKGDSISASLKNLQMRYEVDKSQREAEIERLRNVELKAAYDQLATQNRNILKSINYAQRIQQAILPSSASLQQLLGDHMILFKPRDIVSGDFYWAGEHRGLIFVAAIDCTGHGVPGAFMSLIANELMREIIIEHNATDPGQILAQLDQGVRKSLRQQETSNNDGMDLALCVIDRERRMLRYAGAKNPLLYFVNGQLQHIRATRASVGGSNTASDTQFQTHELPILQPTRIYLCSDGYQDQFGGPQNRKFMARRLHQAIASHASLPFDQQKQELETQLHNWMRQSNEKQLDDILIMSFELNP